MQKLLDFELTQYRNEATHQPGNIRELVITPGLNTDIDILLPVSADQFLKWNEHKTKIPPVGPKAKNRNAVK